MVAAKQRRVWFNQGVDGAAESNRTRRSRTRRWLIVGSVLLALWLVALGLYHYQQYRLYAPSTGDPLLDKYIRVADDEGQLSAEAIAELKAEFADDPRLWEILLSQYVHEEVREFLELPPGLPATVEELFAEAERHDAVSPALIEGLISDLEPFLGGRPPATSESMLAGTESVDAQFGEQRDELYERLVASAPDCAAVYHRRAWLRAMRGEYEPALADVERANAAPLQAVFTAALPGELLSRLRAGRFYADVPQRYKLSGLSISSEFAGIGIRTKDTHLLLWTEALRRDDTAAQQTLHVSACRMATARDADLVQALVALVVLKQNAERRAGLMSATSPEYQKLAVLQGELTALQSELTRIVGMVPNYNALFNRSGLIDRWLLQLGWVRHSTAEFRAYMEDQELRLTDFEQNVVPRFRQVELFDWETLDWPAGQAPAQKRVSK